MVHKVVKSNNSEVRTVEEDPGIDDNQMGVESTRVITLAQGVCEAVAKCAPHLSHVTQGIVLWNDPHSTVVQVDDEIVVKYGIKVRCGEADTLRFVAQETNVPVPQVKGFWEDDEGAGYLVLTLICGSTLYKVWDSLSPDEKEKVVGELAVYFNELHSITGTCIGSVKKGPPVDPMFEGAQPSGPYETEEQMNKAVLQATRAQWKDRGGNPPESFVSTMLPFLPTDHSIVFSHGDLCMTHVMVDTLDQKVTGIVGWSRAGFFPEHWDFVNALVYHDWLCDWIRFVPFLLKPYYAEYGLWYRIRLLAYGRLM